MRFVLWLIAVALFGTPGLLHSENQLPPILASLEVDRNEAFVKEQVLVTLRVGYPPGAFGMSPSVIQASNAELFSLAKTEREEIHQDLPYRIIETKYALFGNTEGVVNLIANISRASLPVVAGGDDSRVNPIIRTSVKPQEIVIRQAPATTTQSTEGWLAASSLTITSDWPEITADLHPGSPVTRRVIIKVQSQHPAAVPQQLKMELPTGLRAYPALAITSLDKTPEGLTGTVILPVTFVASDSGEFELPAIAVPWWNADDRDWQESILPAEKLTVVPVAVGASIYQYLSIGLGLLSIALGILSLFLWRQRIRPQGNKKPTTSEKHAWRKLKKSYQQDNNARWRESITDWLRVMYPENTKPGVELLTGRHPALREMIGALDQGLYSRSAAAELDRPQLMKALVELRKKSKPGETIAWTPDSLYPESIRHKAR